MNKMVGKLKEVHSKWKKGEREKENLYKTASQKVTSLRSGSLTHTTVVIRKTYSSLLTII